MNFGSPGTCTAEAATPPYFDCSYQETDTPCLAPGATCTDALTLRTFTASCAVDAGVAGCQVTPTDSDCSNLTQVCRGGVCAPPPIIGSVSPQVAAQGAKVLVTGSGFTGASGVTIGSGQTLTSQNFTVDSDTQITIPHLDDATPVGAENVQVTNAGSLSNNASVTAIHLVINELDTITPGSNNAQFVELVTGGVPSVSLAGYVLVFFDGASNNSYFSIGLGGTTPVTTNASGYLIVGNTAASTPAPDSTFPNGKLQSGVDAIAVYQGSVASFPNGTAVTAAGLIDALVYTGAANSTNTVLSTTLLITAGQVEADENAHSNASGQSIQRCAADQARRDGRAFAASCVETPTPRAATP